MEKHPPDEYTQTRAEFGHRAITTARAVRSLLEDLIGGFTAMNNVGPPNHPTGTNQGGQNQGGTTEETEERDARAAFDPHYPYFLYDAFRALDELVTVVETRYL